MIRRGPPSRRTNAIRNRRTDARCPCDSATAEQVALLFIPFTANAGTYQRTDSTVTFTPMVAKHPAVQAGGPFTLKIRVKGDTLWGRGAPGTSGGQTWTWVRV